MTRLLILTLLICNNLWAVEKHIFATDWQTHSLCQMDTRFLKNYCLELLELENQDNSKSKNTLLLIPGLFQNANIWDLIPEEKISVARYLQQKFKARIFVLHTRGIGKSDYIPQTNIDDLAIDDLSAAVAFVIKQSKQRPIILGHSQGAIMAQAWAAGISRCGIEKNCFLKATALARSLMVKSIGLIAGNVALTTDHQNSFLIPLAKLGRTTPIQTMLKTWDHIELETITRYTGVMAFSSLWKHVYNIHNVSKKARQALWERTVDSTTGAILTQFAFAVEEQDLKTRGGNSYLQALTNIKSPLYQLTMDNDQLASPQATRLIFEQIGSKNKKFEVINDRGHEDFFMNQMLHSDIDNMVMYLTDPRILFSLMTFDQLVDNPTEN